MTKQKNKQPVMTFSRWVLGPGSTMPEVVQTGMARVMAEASYTDISSRRCLTELMDGEVEGSAARNLRIEPTAFKRMLDEIWRRYLLDVSGLGQVGGLSSVHPAVVALMEVAAKISLQGGLPLGDEKEKPMEMLAHTLNIIRWVVDVYETREEVELANPEWQGDWLGAEITALAACYTWTLDDERVAHLDAQLEAGGVRLVRLEDLNAAVEAVAAHRVAQIELPDDIIVRKLKSALEAVEAAKKRKAEAEATTVTGHSPWG